MELHELRIGDQCAGQRREAEALPAHGGRDGGLGVEPAEAAGGQNRGRSGHLDEHAIPLDQGPAHATIDVLQQPARPGVGPNLNERRGLRRPRRTDCRKGLGRQALACQELIDGEGKTSGIYGIQRWPTVLLIDQGHLVKHGNETILAENLKANKP